jgi:hypothetical protein
MNEILVSQSVLVVTPQPGWSFEGFSGKCAVTAPDRGMNMDGAPVVLQEDLISCLQKTLLGVAYKAQGFDDVPGRIVSTEVTVEAETLTQCLLCGGQPPATVATQGRFCARCIPSARSGSPPVPDPQAAQRVGSWSVLSNGQHLAAAD